MTVPGVVVAWLVTLGLEVPCVAACYPGQRARMAGVAALATSVTNLAMNALLPRWLGTGPAFLLAGEFSALALEATAYFIVARPKDFPRAASASALANGLSFGVGLVLFGLPS